MKAETLIDTLAANLSETDVTTIGKTIPNVKSEQLTHTLTDAVIKAETRKLSEKLANKNAKNFSLRRVKC